jgi:NADPH:quinone reductase-like Zn-dependent oxidoreductase
MKAIVRHAYGSPDVLELAETERPKLEDDRVLVRVRAASVNRADWYTVTGPLIVRPMMGLRRPKSALVGTDFAGTVEAVGKDVTGFRPGDEVFGARDGAFAEYVSARSLAPKPANVTFEEAAAVPVAALTALQGLRDKGRLEVGQSVLINGASGGVGTFAVQIAKALGAKTVTAVCSTRNVELARSLGADRVIDYTREDFTRTGERYDLLYDVAGSRSWSACTRVLEPEATLVIAGGQAKPVVGPLGHVAGVKLAAVPGRRKAVFYIAKFNQPDLAVLGELLESGRVKPVVERTYTLSETADAIRHMGAGHAQGKLVITI